MIQAAGNRCHVQLLITKLIIYSLRNISRRNKGFLDALTKERFCCIKVVADPGFPYIYHLSTKLRDSNVFTGVCLSGGAFPPYLPGTIPPPRDCIPPPQDHTPPRTTKAVGTHILECFLACHFFENRMKLRKICSLPPPLPRICHFKC